MFRQTIYLDIDGMQAKLSVTATLDVDSGRFSIYVFAAPPLSDFKDWRSLDELNVREGEIRLYEDGTNIFTVNGPFDISNRTRQFSTYSGYRLTATGLNLKENSVYRLEIDLEGYPMAWATSVMPEAPVANAVLDTTSVINFRKVADPGYCCFWWGDGSNNFMYPLELAIENMKDKTNNNYYYVQIKTYVQYECTPEDCNISGLGGIGDINDYLYPVGVVDFSIVEHQPGYWSEYYDYSEGAYDLYLLSNITIADRDVAESDISLTLYLPELLYRHRGRTTPNPIYDINQHGPMVHYTYRHELLVRHISEETYVHIKNMELQSRGIDFFTEPVSISGNIQNGYGCFSVSNTKRFNLLNFERYRYPEWSEGEHEIVKFH